MTPRTWPQVSKAVEMAYKVTDRHTRSVLTRDDGTEVGRAWCDACTEAWPCEVRELADLVIEQYGNET